MRDEDTIWRYLDLPKLISLLANESLYFPRVDCFEDPYEGTINKFSHNAYRAETKVLLRRLGKPFASQSLQTDIGMITFPESFNPLTEFGELNKRKWLSTCAYASCWHMNEVESEAMWKLYCKNPEESVVIKTSVGKLIKCCPDNTIVEQVEYINFHNNIRMKNGAFKTFFYKRSTFEHEREVRALLFDFYNIKTDPNGQTIDEGIENRVYGKDEKLNFGIGTFIDEIRISPSAKPWFKDVVEDLVSKYEKTISVNLSEIAIDPHKS